MDSSRNNPTTWLSVKIRRSLGNSSARETAPAESSNTKPQWKSREHRLANAMAALTSPGNIVCRRHVLRVCRPARLREPKTGRPPKLSSALGSALRNRECSPGVLSVENNSKSTLESTLGTTPESTPISESTPESTFRSTFGGFLVLGSLAGRQTPKDTSQRSVGTRVRARTV